MKQDVEIVVQNHRETESLQDYLLHRVRGMTRQKLENLLHKKNVLLNGIPATLGALVSNSDRILLKDFYTSKVHIFPENIPLNIVFENDGFIVINKAAGMSCHAGLGNYKGTLLNALKFYFDSKNEKALENGLVHRLDKETSGLMLIAKSKEAFDNFSELFRNKKVHRHYDAVCYGTIEENSFEVRVNLGRDKENPAVIRCFENNTEGKEAITLFTVQKRSADKTLVECTPVTGRTHQIRLHLRYKGLPIVGDRRYSTQPEAETQRMFLHAKKLEFTYNGKTYSFVAPSGFDDFLRA